MAFLAGNLYFKLARQSALNRSGARIETLYLVLILLAIAFLAVPNNRSGNGHLTAANVREAGMVILGSGLINGAQSVVNIPNAAGVVMNLVFPSNGCIWRRIGIDASNSSLSSN